MFGCLDVWMFRCLDVWMFGCLDVWMFGCLDVWMFGCLDVWIFGSLDGGRPQEETQAARAAALKKLSGLSRWALPRIVVRAVDPWECAGSQPLGIFGCWAASPK